ncbi:hypothetical protein L6R53_33255 [Myxococcota bacterium]|nr:hypothetical protein [Myxococcota bacterium]
MLVLLAALPALAAPDALAAWAASRAASEAAPPDPVAALIHAADACEGGLLPACFAEAERLRELAPAHALPAALAPACEAGQRTACVLALQAGRSLRALDLDPLCEDGQPRACRLAARLRFDASSFERELADGLSRAGRACDLGSALACLRLATMYHHGLGVSVDDAAAAGWEQRSCVALQANGCRMDTLDPARPAPEVRALSGGETLVARHEERDSACLVAVRIDRRGQVEESLRLDCDLLLLRSDLDPRDWRFTLPSGADSPAHALVPVYLPGH